MDPTQEVDQPKDSEVSDSPYFKGKAQFLTLRRNMIPMKETNAGGASALATAHPQTKETEEQEEESERMPFWQGSFKYLGVTFPFRMIGTDPAKGSATSNIRVTIIPIASTFSDGSQLSAAQIACGDTKSPVSRILESPLFRNFSYTLGNTFVGNTQYMDAFQRANFWTDVSRQSPQYHVLLSPQAAPLATIVPDPALSSTVQGPCGRIGFEDIGDLDQRIQNLIVTLQIPQDTLPVFVMYDTFATQGGGCCILGYHSVTFDTKRHPYLVASYSDPNLFKMPIEDIHALSHELGEWLDDPFIRSFIPAWGNVGQVAGCSFSLETGDAVTGRAFEVPMNGFTYHPEDLVFLPWFSRQSPSSSANGQYTFLNSFPNPQGVCGQ